jgi:hypothetical protein
MKTIRLNLREAKVNQDKREIENVIMLEEGLGNLIDFNFYTAGCIRASAARFNGVKANADHKTLTQEENQPERSVKDVVGYWKNCRAVETGGRGRLAGTLKINDGPSFQWAWDMVQNAVEFIKEFPDKELYAISIYGGGDGKQSSIDEVLKTVSNPEVKAKLQEAAKLTETVNVVEELHPESADIVTQAGAGGGFKQLIESIRGSLKSKGRKAMHESFLKAHEKMKQGKMKEAEEIMDAMKDKLDKEEGQLQITHGESEEAKKKREAEEAEEKAKKESEEKKETEEKAKREAAARSKGESDALIEIRESLRSISKENGELKKQLNALKSGDAIDTVIRSFGLEESAEDLRPILRECSSEKHMRTICEREKKLRTIPGFNPAREAGNGSSRVQDMTSTFDQSE